MKPLQGIIAQSVDNALTQYDALGYISTNVSNYNTVAYKGVRFEQCLKENGLLSGVARSDYSEGVFMDTKRPLDLSIKGPGFFPVVAKDGQVKYTRDGQFKVNAEGYLITTDGDIVGDGIKIPPDYYKLKIKPEGDVVVIKQRDGDAECIGKIPVVMFNNPEALKAIGDNKVIPTKDSGKPILKVDNIGVKQGSLERSNISIVGSVEEVMRLNSSLIASNRLIKVVDDLYRQSINLRQ